MLAEQISSELKSLKTMFGDSSDDDEGILPQVSDIQSAFIAMMEAKTFRGRFPIPIDMNSNENQIKAQICIIDKENINNDNNNDNNKWRTSLKSKLNNNSTYGDIYDMNWSDASSTNTTSNTTRKTIGMDGIDIVLFRIDDESLDDISLICYNTLQLMNGGMLIIPSKSKAHEDYKKYDIFTSLRPWTLIHSNQSWIILKNTKLTVNPIGGLPVWKHALGVGWDPSLSHELFLLESCTIYCYANERRLGLLTDIHINKAINSLSESGFVIFRNLFKPGGVLAGGAAALSDFNLCLQELLKRKIDLYRPGEGPPINNYQELSMREARRCDIRNGPSLKDFNRRVTIAANEINTTRSSNNSSSSIFDIEKSQKKDSSHALNLTHHDSILKIVSNTMNPSEYYNPNLNPILEGNWGSWNFEGKGPTEGPPEVKVGTIGCVATLPGALPQTIHADTPHTHVHVQLPAHYINLFLPACDIDSVERSFTVGQTAFIKGSHILNNCAEMMKETPDDIPITTDTTNTTTSSNSKSNTNYEQQKSKLDLNLVRPHLCPGDAILFDCRILHFGLGNSSHDTNNAMNYVTRPLLYCNYMQQYFHDPKNWTNNDSLLS